jgi:hypothetical protein
MCLELKRNQKMKTATDDIICFKVLHYFDNTLTTPYRHCIVELGNTYTSELEITCYNTVEVGLHSFCTIEGAEAELLDWKCGSCPEIRIAKCVIPKGSLYLTGIFVIDDYDYPSYASNTLQYIDC